VAKICFMLRPLYALCDTCTLVERKDGGAGCEKGGYGEHKNGAEEANDRSKNI